MGWLFFQLFLGLHTYVMLTLRPPIDDSNNVSSTFVTGNFREKSCCPIRFVLFSQANFIVRFYFLHKSFAISMPFVISSVLNMLDGHKSHCTRIRNHKTGIAQKEIECFCVTHSARYVCNSFYAEARFFLFSLWIVWNSCIFYTSKWGLTF